MLRSMTGFGQAGRMTGDFKIQLDARSVNHRFCEVVVRMPREWARYEDMVRKTVQQFVKRGRIDIAVHIEKRTTSTKSVEIDWGLLQAYSDAANEIAQRFSFNDSVKLSNLLSLPEAVQIREVEPVADGSDEQLEEELRQCLLEALGGLMEMREAEGRHLAVDLSDRLNMLEAYQRSMTKIAPAAVDEYRAKLRSRVEELTKGELSLDEARLATEVALFAERCNIDEELIRLHSHIEQFTQLITADEPVGRRMEFLLQEMNREVNTIGSKANYLDLINKVVSAKAELEKLREQVQNIE